MKKNSISGFLSGAAIALAIAALLLLASGALLVTGRLVRTGGELVVFTRDALLLSLPATLGLLLALALVHGLMERFSGVHLTEGMTALWMIASLALVLGMNTQQLYDFDYVMAGAETFSRGVYKLLEQDYFNRYSYQLGICLPMEFLLRLCPRLPLGAFMQGFNVFLTAGAAGVFSALAQELFGEQRAARAAMLLYIAYLPAVLYNCFVYSVLPMLLPLSLAILFFTRYLRTRRLRFGALMSVCMGLSVMLKPNAMVLSIALVLCALLDALRSRDGKLPLCALLGLLLGLALKRAVILQYELRAGVTLVDDISMLARFVMGIQESGSSPGWFNRYTERFFPLDVTADMVRRTASADLAARLSELRANPVRALAYFRDKFFSQWIEPTHGTHLYLDVCEQKGPLAALAETLFRQGGAPRHALESWMGLVQQTIYLLILPGAVHALRRRDDAAQVVLPIFFFGGALYHMLFEAKSQYAYVYLFALIPLAAQGLCMMEDALRRWKKGRKAE